MLFMLFFIDFDIGPECFIEEFEIIFCESAHVWIKVELHLPHEPLMRLFWLIDY